MPVSFHLLPLCIHPLYITHTKLRKTIPCKFYQLSACYSYFFSCKKDVLKTSIKQKFGARVEMVFLSHKKTEPDIEEAEQEELNKMGNENQRIKVRW